MHWHNTHEIRPVDPEREQTWSSVKGHQGGKREGLTAGFHQLSIRYTRDASVKLSATPPAFRLIRNTVTCTLFTKKKPALPLSQAQIDPGLTKILNSRIPRFGAHRTLEPANLKGRHQPISKLMKEPIHREPSTLQPKCDQV